MALFFQPRCPQGNTHIFGSSEAFQTTTEALQALVEYHNFQLQNRLKWLYLHEAHFTVSSGFQPPIFDIWILILAVLSSENDFSMPQLSHKKYNWLYTKQSNMKTVF